VQGTATCCIRREGSRELEFGTLRSQEMKSKAASMHQFSPGKEMLFATVIVTWGSPAASLLSV